MRARGMFAIMTDVDVFTIDTADLGDRSYVVTDGEVAAVIDPQRDIDRVIGVLEARDLRLTHVFETHIHNDYVSGGLELARSTGATYAVRDADEVAFERHGVSPGERVDVGSFTVEAVHTPGHTPTHLSYVIRDGEEVVAVFTGGSMLYGAVGRTDLIGPEVTEELAHAQYHSVRGLARELPSATAVFPTHGFGSFCSSNRDHEATAGTVEDEQGRNPALTTDDEERFVRELIAGYTAFPTYYRHMGPLNRSGPVPVDLRIPPSIDPEEITRRVGAGEWVVDVRDRRVFAADHLRGTVNIELGDSFSTYVGWLVPFGVPITLLAGGEDDVATARRALSRIGYDALAGWTVPPVAKGQGSASYEVSDLGGLAVAVGRGDVVVLDVRGDDEWREGHVRGAVHIHLPELVDRLAEVPDGDVWVHCASGIRSAVAASLLDAGGRRVVLVDDDWERIGASGVEVVAEAA